MLSTFLTENRTELIARTRAKVLERASPKATHEEIENGVPLFLSQLASTLELEANHGATSNQEMGRSAAKHGSDLLRKGFTVAQVVHDYGDVCQAVTELAVDQNATITTEEFHTLNRCLDNAIAEAVSEYGRQREQSRSGEEAERLGVLAHELRNLLSTAMLSFQILRDGSVGIHGSTGAVLGRTLMSLRDLVDRSLTEVRLASGVQNRGSIRLAEFIEEVEVAAMLDARARGVQLAVSTVENDAMLEADRQLLASAVSNLLQNAFKYTRPRSTVRLKTRVEAGHVLIDIEDECGGLPPGKIEELFRPFERRAIDRTGLGLGLAISRQGVKASGGEIRVQNLPGKGCIFTIDLPTATQHQR